MNEQTWKSILDELKNKINRPVYEMLIKRIRPGELTDGDLEIGVPVYSMDFLLEHQPVIEEVVTAVVGSPTVIKARRIEMEDDPYIPAETIPTPEPAPRPPTPAATETSTHRTAFLNPRYIFESFVVGSNNRLCHAAALAVAEAPGESYNPLFLYGGTGLGKTHLMQAIGHYLLARRPTMRIEYLTTDAFMNDLMNHIQSNRLVEFRNRYQKVDCLLIDDIQFLQGRDRTQYEFFQIFNTYYETRKQIVITCDRLPKDIPTLEDRLVTRLNWGLLADIKPPDFETRLAILKSKAKSDGVEVPEPVLEVIARVVTTNIRELEGTLTRLIAYSHLSDRPINIELAEEILRDVAKPDDLTNMTAVDIMKVVAAYYNTDLEDMTGKRRTQEIVLPRMVAMYLVREMTKLSLSAIGKEFGNKDHTSVLYSCEKIEKKLEHDSTLKQSLDNIRIRIGG